MKYPRWCSDFLFLSRTEFASFRESADPFLPAAQLWPWNRISYQLMLLSAGTRLGPYEITAAIGAGGMGEVYKARDPRLDRTVAIKVSQEKFSERFEREARAVAALNHPHICILYDVGTDYLVMEYIDGVALKGPLPFDRALKYAVQICDALDAAHQQGITHRDLKPGNILVTKAGIKLLDFGLAKNSRGRETGVVDATMTKALTGEGRIVGTLHYMSPEQLQGQEADARIDIFSFGVVLYEMLTGKQAFAGASPASVIAAILEREAPSVSSVAPPALDHVLRRCLAKDRENRWQTARDLKAELEWIVTSDSVALRTVPRRALFPWIGGVAAGASAVGLATWAWHGTKQSASTRPIRFRLAPPEGTSLERVIIRQSLALSPAGGRVAMIATGEQGPMIWVQRLDSLTASPLQGTEGAAIVFWSPDGQTIGFWAAGKLKRIAAEGGTALSICDLSGASSATWNQDGTIVTGKIRHDLPSHVVSVRSGSISPWKVLLWPKFLPDGKHLLYVRADPKFGTYRAYVAELSTGRESALMLTDNQVIFVPDQWKGGNQGYLLFGRNSTLLALRFDADRLQVVGEPMPVAKEVPFFEPTAWSEFEASADGVLIYSTGSQQAQLTWFDRGGRQSGTLGNPQGFAGDLRVSPDGKKLAAGVLDFSTGGSDIWVYDLSQGTAERVTFGSSSGAPVSGGPVWSPDNTRIAFFVVTALAAPQLRVKTVTDRGSGEQFPPGPFQMPCDWSSDGRWIFFTTAGAENGEIWLASANDRKIMPLLQTPFDSASPTLSWDGQYLAFSANDSARYEIYVQRFQGGDSPKLVGERRRVSYNGGNFPRWRRDGKELFFLSADGQIMAVAVKPGHEPEFGPPTALFRLSANRSSMGSVGGYEVSHDGLKFVAAIRKGAGAPLQVVVDWQAGLKK
jgi:Tol biopolymer transport system component/tRNA A-37 threonylcarbamoyl transferase component Bud32